MTLDEALGRVEDDRPGEADKGELVRWISQLDAKWKREVVDTHERIPEDRRPYGHFMNRGDSHGMDFPPFGDAEGPFTGYSRDFDGARTLMIPPPWDEAYVYYLYAQMDQKLGEIERYNNDAALFNTAWADAAAWYNRTHMPLRVKVNHVVYGRWFRRGPDEIFGR